VPALVPARLYRDPFRMGLAASSRIECGSSAQRPPSQASGNPDKLAEGVAVFHPRAAVMVFDVGRIIRDTAATLRHAAFPHATCKKIEPEFSDRIVGRRIIFPPAQAASTASGGRTIHPKR